MLNLRVCPRAIAFFLFISSVVALCFLKACDTPDETPDYSPEYFGPAVDSRINIEDISQLENIVLKQEIDPTDIQNGFQGQQTVPPFNLDRRVGPYPFSITEVFEEIQADSLVFQIGITNSLPIPLNPDTEIVFRNQSDDSLIYRKVIEKSVAPGEELRIDETVTDKLVENDINFFLENLTSEGSNGEQVNFDNAGPADFEFELVFLDIERIIINKGESYTITDTSNVSYSGPTDTSSSASGQVFISLENRFPLNFDLQLLFLDDEQAIFDSVLNKRIQLDGAPVNEDGLVIGDQTRSVDTIQIDTDQLNALKEADQLSTEFRASTVDEDANGDPIPSVTLEIEDQSFLRLQVGVDAKINAE
jgi:hypothetical protein